MDARLKNYKRWLDIEYDSQDTINSYFYTVKQFHKEVGLDDFDTDHIMDWVLEKEGWSDNTARRHIYALKCFATYDGRSIDWDRVPTPKQKEHDYRTLSYDELRTVFRSCETIREKAIVRLSYDLALRVGELVKIRHEHIDFDSGEIELDRLKKGSEIRTELDPQTLGVLNKYREWLNGYKEDFEENQDDEINDLDMSLEKNKGRLFPWSTRHIGYICDRIGERADIDFTIHVLRHSRATHLSQKEGWKRGDVQQLLGHKEGETTDKYIKPESARITEKKKEATTPNIGE